ncbi:MAG: hypothetical protein HKN14_02610 [Marinicaulis sp.]|nr:hypothetical protein [Marinicaulis sp.]NNL90507.1 hypothetical protein [Marinicaulis sp.]
MSSYAVVLAAIALCLTPITGCASDDAAASTKISKIFELEDGRLTAPFGDTVSENIFRYSRVSPNVGLAGKLTPEGVHEAKALGFNLVVDLRQPDENGVAEEKAIVAEIGLPYENAPLVKDRSALAQIDYITGLLEDESNYPVLIHCGTSNRAGAFWAIYRAGQGVPNIVAIEEGRAGGLTSREAFVREMLGMPAE